MSSHYGTYKLFLHPVNQNHSIAIIPIDLWNTLVGYIFFIPKKKERMLFNYLDLPNFIWNNWSYSHNSHHFIQVSALSQFVLTETISMVSIWFWFHPFGWTISIFKLTGPRVLYVTSEIQNDLVRKISNNTQSVSLLQRHTIHAAHRKYFESPRRRLWADGNLEWTPCHTAT